MTFIFVNFGKVENNLEKIKNKKYRHRFNSV
jgi:hypothetical protein